MAHAGLKFGIFLAPFHRLGDNPTLAIHRDIDLLVALDSLGFDEARVGVLTPPRARRPGPET